MSEIKAYEPYHIGIKLKKFVNLEVEKEKLKKSLKSKKFTVIEAAKDKIKLPVDIKLPTETISSKDGVNVQINYPVSAVNTIGKDSIHTYKNFEMVVKSLKEQMDLGKSVIFYEIIADPIIKMKKNVQTLFKNKIKIKSKALSKFKQNLCLTGINFYNEIEENELVEVVVYPNPTNPTKEIRMKILLRSKNLEILKRYNKDIENIIKEIIISL